MNKEITQLKKLIKELNEISVNNQSDWSKIKSWIAKATPTISKFFPDFYSDFQEICKSPGWQQPRYNSFSMNTITGETSGEPVTYFHEENARITSSSKTNILSFLEGILETVKSSEKENTSSAIIDSKKVFIVHGRDDLAKEQTARFLEKVELEAIILHEQSSRGKTVIEKLEHYTDVAFAIVILTPDDVGALATEKKNLKLRARQNVIFELGYLIGKLGRENVCALLKDNVEKPTDYDGVVYVQMDDNGAWKQEIVKELKAAKINGNFERLYS